MGYYNMEFDLGVDYNCDSENGCKEKQTVADEGRQKRMSDIVQEKCRLNKINLMEMIISDKRCDKEITKYYNTIARVAVAEPPVLILDEATSSIDTRTEKIVQEGMDQLMKGRTVFVVAHRLSTIKNSDVIKIFRIIS